uniref:VWFA domain-containing protein n=1 Tax=Arcella intermedia TaxID=1963864 RepID=A0A6B2LFC1_9EUKA
MESSNLIVAVDYTRSNTWNGKNSFGGQCLHSISPYTLNPYQAALSLVCKTLEPFDDDHLIPAFGFGDVTTRDKAVFPFFPDNRSCQGLNEVLTRYSEITPRVELSGPTSFAPIIREAIKIVSKTSAYHILIIIADGQVDKVQETIDAIVECSKYPISIILIGVGDGPWDRMMEFDDELPQRQFDNFQFVNFNELSTKWKGNEVNFAMHALMEIPDQYKAIKQLKLL